MKRLLAGLAAGLVLGGGVAGAATFVIDNATTDISPTARKYLEGQGTPIHVTGTPLVLLRRFDSGSATVTCPTGYYLLSGGYALSATEGDDNTQNALVSYSGPGDDSRTWKVSAEMDSASPTLFADYVTAVAMCGTY